MKSSMKIVESLYATLNHINSGKSDPNADPTSIVYLKWMCEEILSNHDTIHGCFPIDKTHRWIGYIQGVMISKNWSTLDDERSRVRNVPDVNIYVDFEGLQNE